MIQTHTPFEGLGSDPTRTPNEAQWETAPISNTSKAMTPLDYKLLQEPQL
jgi:hypothetical protein